jgi:hypothetical protein
MLRPRGKSRLPIIGMILASELVFESQTLYKLCWYLFVTFEVLSWSHKRQDPKCSHLWPSVHYDIQPNNRRKTISYNIQKVKIKELGRVGLFKYRKSDVTSRQTHNWLARRGASVLNYVVYRPQTPVIPVH